MDLSIFGWVGVSGWGTYPLEKQKKHALKIHFRLLCLHLLSQSHTTATPITGNQHHPLLPTSDTHHNKPPLMPPTMVGGGSGVHQWLVAMMGGSK